MCMRVSVCPCVCMCSYTCVCVCVCVCVCNASAKQMYVQYTHACTYVHVHAYIAFMLILSFCRDNSNVRYNPAYSGEITDSTGPENDNNSAAHCDIPKPVPEPNKPVVMPVAETDQLIGTDEDLQTEDNNYMVNTHVVKDNHYPLLIASNDQPPVGQRLPPSVPRKISATN